MRTIHDLPLEIIGRIFEIAYPFSLARYRDKATGGFLRATSLVCREWTPLAQAELWKFVCLLLGRMKTFIAAGPGLHPIKILILNAWGQADNCQGVNRNEAILRAVRGVQTLIIAGGNIDSSWLCAPGLTDLKVLDLYDVKYSCQIPPALPFNLHVLKLGAFDDQPPPALLNALSQQSSLTSLLLESSSPTALESFLPLAPQLSTLDVSGRTDLKVFLSKCTRLEALTVQPRSIRDINRLPNSLHSLKVTFTQESDVAPILDLINSKATAVRALQSLTVHVHDEESEVEYSEEEALEVVEEWDRWRGVEEVSRQKKIKLVVTGKVDL